MKLLQKLPWRPQIAQQNALAASENRFGGLGLAPSIADGVAKICGGIQLPGSFSQNCLGGPRLLKKMP